MCYKRCDVSNLWDPGVAFCTGELKKASLKKCKDPLKTTRALFLACSPAIRRVFFPTAWGYCDTRGEHEIENNCELLRSCIPSREYSCLILLKYKQRKELFKSYLKVISYTQPGHFNRNTCPFMKLSIVAATWFIKSCRYRSMASANVHIKH